MKGRDASRVGWVSLLIGEYSMFAFLWYALSVAERPVPPFTPTPTLHTQEVCMHQQDDATDLVHAEVHIDVCPNDVLHVKIGSICLHLCREDFLQLARALGAGAAQLSATAGSTGTGKGNVHRAPARVLRRHGQRSGCDPPSHRQLYRFSPLGSH